MAEKVARVGDNATGVCNRHDDPVPWSGIITTGSPNHTVEGAAIARIDDTGTTSCGHTFRITEGSDVLSCDGKKVARRGDSVVIIGGSGGTGTIATGADNVTTE